MDLNELLHAHQVAVMRASASGDEESRRRHFDMVAVYAERIRLLKETHRTAHPATLASSREAPAYKPYATGPASGPNAASVQSWESEGGALYPPFVPLPSGITARMVREYLVGPYVYHDLSLAMAEYERQQMRAASDAASHE